LAKLNPGAKLGLCLSGGGFRAALFHIGTLAALAERRLLHRVEVLSTVSGGSIIGAFFYLKVKQLLEGRRPRCPEPRPEHYLDIVQEIEVEFLKAVQKNMRLRLVLNPYKTARMLLEEEYSRSDRLSELLSEFLYSPISLVDRLALKDINIVPAGSGPKPSAIAFNAAPENDCKIPILTINSTCLNTGHPFHFTGAWVGEPARSHYAREQNSNVVLPQMRFDGTYQNEPGKPITDAQKTKLAQLALADAVAASAAVPGIFPPLPVHDLYFNSQGQEIVLELSDGGVYDNLGIDALLNAQCSHVIISDASGQLEDERLLPADAVSTARRANDVMMERIRGSGYADLWSRSEGCRLLSEADEPSKEFLKQHCFISSHGFMHLREEASNKPDLPPLPGPANKRGGLVYRASGIRTDLDSFNDIEADALMYHGYTLAQEKLAVGALGDDVPKPLRQWRFLAIQTLLANSEGQSRLLKHLRCGKNQFFKTFRLAPSASWGWLAFLLSPLLLATGVWLYEHWTTPLTLPQTAFTAAELAQRLAILLVAILPMSAKVRGLFKTVPWLRPIKENPATHVFSWILSLLITVLSVGASLLVFIYLRIYDAIFLRVGQYRDGIK